MKRYIIRRLLLFIPTLVLVSIIIFTVMRIIPGDPAMLILGGWEGEGSFTQEELEALKRRWC